LIVSFGRRDFWTKLKLERESVNKRDQQRLEANQEKKIKLFFEKSGNETKRISTDRFLRETDFPKQKEYFLYKVFLMLCAKRKKKSI